MNLYEFLSTYPDKWPTVIIYKECLTMACAKFGIDENKAAKRYGLYTGKEWLQLLDLKEPCSHS